MKVAIVCIAKMEENYIREFIQHYYDIGVDHIYIGDNNDSNYNKKLENVIHDFLETNYVTIDDLHDKKNFQCKFYQKKFKEHKTEFDWIGFLDIDEYLVFKKSIDIKTFLSQDKFNDFNSIVFPWVIYDDNDLLINDHKPLNQRFTHKSNFQSYEVKSFYRTNFDIIPSMHYGHNGKDIIIQCDPNGNKYPLLMYTIFNEIRSKYVGTNDPDAFIKHFRYKTIKEFILKKIIAGRPCRFDNSYWLDNRSDIQILDMFFKFNRRTKYKEKFGLKLLKELRVKHHTYNKNKTYALLSNNQQYEIDVSDGKLTKDKILKSINIQQFENKIIEIYCGSNTFQIENNIFDICKELKKLILSYDIAYDNEMLKKFPNIKLIKQY